jgi:hypothetical protein
MHDLLSEDEVLKQRRTSLARAQAFLVFNGPSSEASP